MTMLSILVLTMRRNLCHRTLAAWAVAALVNCPAEVALVHSQVTCSSLTKLAAADLLEGRSMIWGDGTRVQLVLSRGDSGRGALPELCERDLERLLRGWKRLVFTGGGSMPLVVDDDQQAMAVVARTPGAIAFFLAIPKPIPPGTNVVQVNLSQLQAEPR